MNYDYKYQLYPTSEQKQTLEFTRNTCRKVYNYYLEKFKTSDEDVYMSKYETQSDLTRLKSEWSELNSIHSRVLQMTIHQLFNNLESVTPQYEISYNVDRLRYKGEGWYKTFTYHQSGFDLQQEDTRLDSLYLSKIGTIPIRYHRDIPTDADIKQVKIKKEGNDKWYAIFGIETDEKTENPTNSKNESIITIGAGINTFSVDSDGVGVKSPNFDEENKKINRCKQNLSRKQKDSNNYKKEQKHLWDLRTHINNKQRDFLHKLSRYYVDEYDVILIESRYLGRSNPSWWDFVNILKYKAESAGTLVLEIPYKEESQYLCSNCNTHSLDHHWLREQECPSCGSRKTRDKNHLEQIYKEGKSELGLGQTEVKPVDIIATMEDLESSMGGMAETGSSTKNKSSSLP